MTDYLSTIMPNLFGGNVRHMTTLAERIKECADETPDFTKRALAKFVGISPASVGQWFDGRTKNLEGANLLRAAEFLRVNPLWLAEGRGPKRKPPTQAIAPVGISALRVEEPRATYRANVTIQQYETGGKMGHGLVLRDQPGIIAHWEVSPEWLRANIPHCTSYANLRIITGYGDSNKGLYNSGDPLIVDIGVRTIDRDAVFFFRVAEEGYIKQLQRIPSAEGLRIKVTSYNAKYDPWWIEPGMDFEVFGQVIKVWEGKNL